MKNCEWLDEQPAFFKEVFVDGERIATIKALTMLDDAEIQRKCGNKIEYAKNGSTYLTIFADETELTKMLHSLTGHKKAGWVFDRELNVENLALLPKVYYNAIKLAMIELEKQNDVGAEVEGN
jgi:hypothetical protein